MEHRIGHRQPTREEVLLSEGANSPVRAILTDLSISGAFIRTPSKPATESQVRVYLKRSSKGKLPGGLVSAHVVRQSTEGFAVEWAKFAPRAVCIRLNKRWLYQAQQDLQRVSDPR